MGLQARKVPEGVQVACLDLPAKAAMVEMVPVVDCLLEAEPARA